MRNFISYILAGFIAVLVMDVIAPSIGLSLAVFAWPAADGPAMHQIVDRTHKSDRLQIPTRSGRQTVPQNTPVLVGCEPVFSSLSKGNRSNFPGRCIS
jgi:hypothetical protein